MRIARGGQADAGDDEVLVKVHATTVNRTDCAYRAANPFFMRLFTGLIRPRVTVLGNEFAGVVEAVGRGVTTFESAIGCSATSRARSVPTPSTWRCPQAVRSRPCRRTSPTRQAAASTEGSHYALAHIRGAKITGGQDVLVYGATGAIGSAAVQLLKSLGANVTAVCGTEHVELVGGLGADRVIDYTAEDFTQDEQTYDVVLDAVGKSSFGQMQAVAETGRDVHLVRAGSVCPESVPGPHRSAAAAARRSGSRSRSTTRR